MKTLAHLSAYQNTALLMVEREWRRMISEPSRVFGVLLQPLLFLLVFGVGFHRSFRLPSSDMSYVAFFYPGILGLVVLFSSIYATLTLVDDKKCGFFRLVLSGPGGVKAAVLGKVLATASLGFAQSLLFLPLVFFLPLAPSAIALLNVVVFLLIGSLCFALIGVLFAWISGTPSAFHALMSVVLIPMWLLSGAMFPISDGILYGFSFLNPMAYLVSGLRASFLATYAIPELVMLITFSLLYFMALWWLIKKRPIE